MKINLRQLKSLIRQTINEAGTSGTRGGIAVPGSSNDYNSGETWFPGHDKEYPVIRQGFDDDSLENQGLASPGGEYVDGVGWVVSTDDSTDDLGDKADDAMDKSSGKSKDEFFLVVDSQITRGKGGDIEHVPTGNIFTVKEEKNTSGSLSADLNIAYQKSSGKSAKQRCKDVVAALTDHGILTNGDISEVGICGRDSKKIYDMEEYFMEFNNRFITERKRRYRNIL